MQKKREEFQDTLKSLFDIAQHQVEYSIYILEDHKFLHLQRRKGDQLLQQMWIRSLWKLKKEDLNMK